ncbi:thiamine-phosphate kinase [Luteimonas lutimaris]|uniref:Thiamine-monophosphate kinase n=1 Tax=Luteimonas lutimaris TaxID=698645 RepID=A0ABP7N0K4_9GAMM
MPAEFSLIDAIARRAAARDDVVLGIGDDAAILAVPAGRQLVVAMDTLNAGVHFPEDTAAADIGWKALAVNLSDLAAMGAQPAWCTLSLSLPEPGAGWVDGFLDGFLTLAALHGVALVGGDTTRGPLSVCVTAHGLVEAGRALRRDGACVGDDLWVTGAPGDAAGALAQWRAGGERDAALRARLDRPTPRVEAGLALAAVAHAAIDVSDGLLADLGHVCAASGMGMEVELDALPASPMLAAAFDPGQRRVLQCTGGDDYELCFTAAREQREGIAVIAEAVGVAMTRIGRVVPGDAVVALECDGRRWDPPRRGFEHFAD